MKQNKKRKAVEFDCVSLKFKAEKKVFWDDVCEIATEVNKWPAWKQCKYEVDGTHKDCHLHLTSKIRGKK